VKRRLIYAGDAALAEFLPALFVEEEITP